jgi:hypothetical protein
MLKNPGQEMDQKQEQMEIITERMKLLFKVKCIC